MNSVGSGFNSNNKPTEETTEMKLKVKDGKNKILYVKPKNNDEAPFIVSFPVVCTFMESTIFR